MKKHAILLISMLLISVVSCYDNNIKSSIVDSESVMMDYLNRAYNLNKEDMNELALSYCEKALEMNKNSWKPYALLGFIYFYMEDYKTVEDNYEEYRELN